MAVALSLTDADEDFLSEVFLTMAGLLFSMLEDFLLMLLTFLLLFLLLFIPVVVTDFDESLVDFPVEFVLDIPVIKAI